MTDNPTTHESPAAAQRRFAAGNLTKAERLEAEGCPEEAEDCRVKARDHWKQAAKLEPLEPKPPADSLPKEPRFDDARLYPVNAYELRYIASRQTLAKWRSEGKDPAFVELHEGEAGIAYRGAVLNAFLGAAWVGKEGDQ